MSKFLLGISILLVTFTLNISTLEGLQHIESNWKEVNHSPEGRQWWDKNSLSINKSEGFLTVQSRFIPFKTGKEIVLNYQMDIDCKTKLFRDSYVNGKINTSDNWLETKGDILINEVIKETCSYITN